MLDGYLGYNQIFIAEEDVSKTTFRCPGALGCYEWLVMPFGLKNVGKAQAFSPLLRMKKEDVFK